MRCQSCNKKFDYDKYHGICPKCGSFNQQQSRQERHEELHEYFGDGSTHSQDWYNDLERKQQSSPSYEQEQSYTQPTRPHYPTTERRASGKKGGTGLMVVGITVFVIGLVAFITGIISIVRSTIALPATSETEFFEVMEEVQSHEIGEFFDIQESIQLCVAEAVVLADSSVFPTMEEGKVLIAINMIGESDGEYEDYNQIAEPYLEVDGTFIPPISAYSFEPYAQMFGGMNLMDEYSLKGDDVCEGWYPFLIDQDAETLHIWFDAYDWSDWDGGNRMESHVIALELQLEGGELSNE